MKMRFTIKAQDPQMHIERLEVEVRMSTSGLVRHEAIAKKRGLENALHALFIDQGFDVKMIKLK